VFLLDPWWNPAVERQAIDRAHRIGQRRAVIAYRLVARDTIEDKVLELQAKKRALADALYEGSGTGLARITRDDLEWMLS
jgi:SNF2 family DNA or RNA helicase